MDPIFRHLPADLDSLSIIDTRSRKYGTNFEVPGYDDDYRTCLTHTEIAATIAGNPQSFAGLTYIRMSISTGRQSSHWYYTGEGDGRFYYAEIPLDVLRILAGAAPCLAGSTCISSASVSYSHLQRTSGKPHSSHPRYIVHRAAALGWPASVSVLGFLLATRLASS
ncbi:hypothetical protein B0H10DRAFT_1947418 [Mycena sp. CBHHK59/15]|nr:hypothetical protein B0H10DRAFT_1947418 [Mycena sp. CBHHK59/15]